MTGRKAWWGVVAGALGCAGDGHGASGLDASQADATVVDTGAEAGADAASEGNASDASAPGDVEELRFRKGSRLKPVVLRAAGAPELFTAIWYDEELASECTFMNAPGGERRCLPSAALTSYDVYLDANCSAVVYASSPSSACQGTPVPKFATQVGSCEVDAVFAITPAPTDLATRPLYARASGTCTELVGSQLASYRSSFTTHETFVRGEPVALTRFVKVVRQDRSDGVPSRLATVGEDDSLIVGGYLNAGGVRCTPSHVGNVDVCLPKLAVLDSRFASPTCTMPLLTQSAATSSCIPADADPAPASLAIEYGPACSTQAPRFYGVGAKHEGNVYGSSNGMCSAAAAPAEGAWLRGAELSESALVHVTSRLEGDGRLRVRSFFDDRGRRLAVDGQALWDDEFKQACSAGIVIEGERYCGPARMETAYADAACTQRVLISSRCGMQPGQLALLSSTAGGPGECRQEQVVTLGEPLAPGAVTYERTSGCTPRASSSEEVFRYGTELPVTRLLRLERVAVR